MAEFGTAGAGLRDEDRRALKEGKKLLKKALGAAGMGGLIKGGKNKEKLRREKQRRREEEQARAAAETRARQSAARAAMVRRYAAAERAKVEAARAEAATERAKASTARAEAEADSKSLAAERAATAAERAVTATEQAAAAKERAAAAAARAEAESDYKSLAAERALAERATEDGEVLRSALAAEHAAARARAQREAEANRRRLAAERELDEAQEVAQAYARDVEAELEDARAVAARTQEFYETERVERETAQRKEAEAERRRQAAEETAQRKERALREQIRTMERELEEHERGGFTDVCGLFGGVSGGVAARARGAALRKAKQELEQRRAELAVVVAQNADRERAFADELAAEREAREAAKMEAERERARWYAASFELQTAEKHAQNTIDLKNLELQEQVERSNAMKTELEYEAERKAAMDIELGQASLRERLNEAKLQDTVAEHRAELSRLKAELEQARSTAPVGDEGALVADLKKLDKAVSSLLAKKNELKNEVRSARSRMPINNNGYPIEYAMDAVEKDFEAMRKMIQEFRARAHRKMKQARSTAAPVGDEGDGQYARDRGVEELLTDLNKLDRAVSSLLANKNELKNEVWRALSRAMATNDGHPIEYAMKAVEEDFEDMCKVIQEVRARVRTLEPSRLTEAALQVNKLDKIVPSLLANINEVEKYMQYYQARPQCYPSEYALDDVRKDFKRVCKVVQEFRAHVHTLNASGSTVEAPSAPVGLRVADVNDIGVKLEWCNAEGEDRPASGFDVQYKPYEQIHWEDLDVASPQCEQSFYLVRGMRYCFRVRVAAPGVKPTSPWSRSIDATQRSWVEAAERALDASGAPPPVRPRRQPGRGGGRTMTGHLWRTTDGELRGPTTLREYKRAHAAGITNTGRLAHHEWPPPVAVSSSPSHSEAVAIGAWRCSCHSLNYTGATEWWNCGLERPAGAGPTAAPCGLWVADVDDHAVELEWCNMAVRPEKGFDVQYKLHDQMQWEDANVTLFTFHAAPDWSWGCKKMNLQPGTRYCFRVRVAASSIVKPASPWSRPCDATTTEQGLRTVADADRGPPQPESAPKPVGPSPAATFGSPAAPAAPPPAPRAPPQPAVVQQTTYYSSSPSPQMYIPRPAPAPPRRSSSGGARMGTVLRNDGMPDRRYSSPRPVTNSGRPDRRFSVNRRR